MDTITWLIALLVAIVVVLALATAFRLVTVHDYERGLRYSRGRFRGLVPAGSHFIFRPLEEIRVLDARPGYVQVDGQEILLRDGSSVRVSLAARYVLGDPVTAVTGDRDAWHALYVSLQLGLRDELAPKALDEAIADRSAIGPAILERVSPAVSALGLELKSVDVRDVMVSGDLRRAYASVVVARKEGEAALERARSETAALRNLANAGRMIEDHPGLLQLRLLQQVGGASGNTLMVNVPEGAARTAGRPSPPEPVVPTPAPKESRKPVGRTRRSTPPPGR
ncbi:MAG TPA: slipin family protein [Candidatus Limnocylindrales bacterium]